MQRQREQQAQQLADTQARLAAKETSSRKYKEAVRALKVRVTPLSTGLGQSLPTRLVAGAQRLLWL